MSPEESEMNTGLSREVPCAECPYPDDCGIVKGGKGGRRVQKRLNVISFFSSSE